MPSSPNINAAHLDANVASPEVPLNTSLDLLDEAIAGVLVHNIASDADYTLSLVTTPTKEWQYGTIKITDTGVLLTVARNIIVPVNEKQYIFINATAQDLTIKTSAGTGISVVAGGQSHVLCDGTNVVEATSVTSKVDITSIVAVEGQSWAGISYTDPDAIGANPAAKIYPDGTIVGSTDNGSYTKYPNGDLVCRSESLTLVTASVSVSPLFFNDGAIVTFPVAFISKPLVVSDVNGASGLIWSAHAEADTTATTTQLRVFSTAGTATGYPMYEATGRWK